MTNSSFFSFPFGRAQTFFPSSHPYSQPRDGSSGTAILRDLRTLGRRREAGGLDNEEVEMKVGKRRLKVKVKVKVKKREYSRVNQINKKCGRPRRGGGVQNCKKRELQEGGGRTNGHTEKQTDREGKGWIVLLYYCII